MVTCDYRCSVTMTKQELMKKYLLNPFGKCSRYRRYMEKNLPGHDGDNRGVSIDDKNLGSAYTVWCPYAAPFHNDELDFVDVLRSQS